MTRSPLKIILSIVAILSVGAALTLATSATAKERKSDRWSLFSKHPKSSQYRKNKPQVRGYRRRVGGYSYNYLESGGALGDFQEQGGPFDSGYFFDSGSRFDSGFGAPGGDAPYFH